MQTPPLDRRDDAVQAIDGWKFDGTTELVAGHLEARAMQRKVLIGCTLVGLVGVGILLTVIAGGPIATLTTSSIRV